MLDPELEYVLGVLGYVVASHVMCRASIGKRSGAYEEPLTADLRDIFELYDVCTPYLSNKGSSSQMQMSVHDLAKAAESRLGADFIIAMRGRDDDGAGSRREVRKVVCVQAKRQDFSAKSLTYASSRNHVEKAKSMVRAVGIDNAYFAFYHSASVIPSAPQVTWQRASHSRPQLFYLFPAPSPTSHLYLSNHPRLGRQTFLEVSGYRSVSLMRQGALDLPNYEWGVALLNADYFVDSKGSTVKNSTLPSVHHVLETGMHLPKFLLELAECRKAENLPDDPTFRNRVSAVLSLSTSGRQESLEFDPSFMVFLEFDSRHGQSRGDWRFIADDISELVPQTPED
jgi:hypothetical protein